MSHDKFVLFVDTQLKSELSQEAREDLLALHYAAVHNAKTQGVVIGQRMVLDAQGVPTEPKMPPNEIVKDNFLWLPSVISVSIVISILAAVFGVLQTT